MVGGGGGLAPGRAPPGLASWTGGQAGMGVRAEAHLDAVCGRGYRQRQMPPPRIRRRGAGAAEASHGVRGRAWRS